MKQFECRLDRLYVNQMFNSRFEIAPSSCQGLAESIRKNGLLQPVIVRKAKESDGVKADYVLLAGFRRYIAFKYLLKRDRIPAKLVSTDEKGGDEEINFVENMVRENLTITEESLIVDKLIKEGLSVSEISRRLDRSREWVYSRKDFIGLPDEVKLMVESNNLSLAEVTRLLKKRRNRSPALLISDARRILQNKVDRQKDLEENKKKPQKNYKARVGQLASYLLRRESSDSFKQAISALLWVQGEIPTGHLFELLGLTRDEALEFEVTTGEK